MWYWYLIVAAVAGLLGGWGGYTLGAKVYTEGEAAVMTAAGYFKQGENWIKRAVLR